MFGVSCSEFVIRDLSYVDFFFFRHFSFGIALFGAWSFLFGMSFSGFLIRFLNRHFLAGKGWALHCMPVFLDGSPRVSLSSKSAPWLHLCSYYVPGTAVRSLCWYGGACRKTPNYSIAFSTTLSTQLRDAAASVTYSETASRPSEPVPGFTEKKSATLWSVDLSGPPS